MPSPFPGMDPYLESRTLWPDFHNAFIVYLRAVINRQLPPGFSTRIEDGVQVRQLFIEIHAHDTQGRRVLTVIELLSHSNKSGGRGREEYLAKQKTLLASEVHLLELDLLRAGEYTLAASQNSLRARFGPFDYAASLHRGDYGRRFQAVAWNVQDPLPTVLVPLDEAHEYTYDECGFARMVDYTASPETAFSDPGVTTWVTSMSAS